MEQALVAPGAADKWLTILATKAILAIEAIHGGHGSCSRGLGPRQEEAGLKRPRMRGKIKRKSAVASLAQLGDDELNQMARKARYEPSPYHKSGQEAERWGLSRAVHRPDTTLCEAGSIGGRRDAVRLLRLGIRLGMISQNRSGDWPQNVWAVDDEGVAYEAQLSNRDVGEYHGYPMKRYDEFTGFVKRVWRERSQ